MKSTTKPNKAFWIIAVLAIIWNIIGVFQVLSATFMEEEMRSNLDEVQLALMNSLPSWYNIVFSLAVFSGLLGSILLLMKKKIAIPVFGISLISVLIYMGYWIFATEATEVYGGEAVLMPLIVIVIAIFLYFYSKGAAKNGWLS